MVENAQQVRQNLCTEKANLVLYGKWFKEMSHSQSINQFIKIQFLLIAVIVMAKCHLDFLTVPVTQNKIVVRSRNSDLGCSAKSTTK